MFVVHFLKFILILFFSQSVVALGLGNIQVYSYLNEPLSAEIEVIGAENIDVANLRAALASNKDFERAGITLSASASGLKFSVLRVSQKTFVFVQSERPIRTPDLRFLVNLLSPTGNLVKSYTVLLDPSEISDINTRTVPRHQQLQELMINETLIKSRDAKIQKELASPLEIDEVDSEVMPNNLMDNFTAMPVQPEPQQPPEPIIDFKPITLGEETAEPVEPIEPKEEVLDRGESSKLVQDIIQDDVTSKAAIPKEPVKEPFIEESPASSGMFVELLFYLGLIIGLTVGTLLYLRKFKREVYEQILKKLNIPTSDSLSPSTFVESTDTKESNLQNHEVIDVDSELMNFNEDVMPPAELYDSINFNNKPDINVINDKDAEAKLELAKNYIAIEDYLNAKPLLIELIEKPNQYTNEAKKLLEVIFNKSQE